MSLLITRGLGRAAGGGGEAVLPLQVVTVLDEIQTEVQVELAEIQMPVSVPDVELTVTIETDEIHVEARVEEGPTIEAHYGE